MTTLSTCRMMTASALFFLLLPVITRAQNGSVSCTDLKKGDFNAYPKNTNSHLIIHREGDLQKEINPKTGDTTLWKVKWKNDCTFSLTYLSGSYAMDYNREYLLKQHNFVYKILSLTKDYYVMEGHVDNAKSAAFQNDTVWFKERAFIPDNIVYEKISNLELLETVKFTDTAKYAILYTYRPGKTTCEAEKVLISFNDNAMFAATDKSKNAFILLKEGKYTLKGQAAGKESTVELDVKFGRKYYLASEMHWGATCAPELAIVKEDEGKTHFDTIR